MHLRALPCRKPRALGDACEAQKVQRTVRAMQARTNPEKCGPARGAPARNEPHQERANVYVASKNHCNGAEYGAQPHRVARPEIRMVLKACNTGNTHLAAPLSSSTAVKHRGQAQESTVGKHAAIFSIIFS